MVMGWMICTAIRAMVTPLLPYQLLKVMMQWRMQGQGEHEGSFSCPIPLYCHFHSMFRQIR